MDIGSRSKIWTVPKITLLTELWLKGIPARVIGSQLGFSTSAILGKVYRLKLVKRRESRLTAIKHLLVEKDRNRVDFS
jgi:hypothetical protein